MVVSTSVVARRYEDVSAGTPISVDIPAYEVGDVYVYYGNASLVAVQGTDYTVALAGDFETFTVTPTASLLTKINALIAGDPLEENYITVRRVLDYLTDATPDGVRYTPFTSREFDRLAMRDAQMAEKLQRTLSLSPSFVGSEPLLELKEVVPGRALIFNEAGTAIEAGPNATDIEGAQNFAAAAAASAAAAALYAPAYYNTLAGLLDDDETVWPEGMILNTREEGFAFVVAAPHTTDHHLTTAGGVKLYVLPGAGGFNVMAFGAMADGVTDDTAAVQTALRYAAVSAVRKVRFATNHRITDVNLTKLFYSGLIIEGLNPTHQPSPDVATFIVTGANSQGFDLSGSSGIVWRGVSMRGDALAAPRSAIFAQRLAGAGANESYGHVFENVRILGHFTDAGVYNFAGEFWDWQNSYLWCEGGGGRAFYYTTTNSIGRTSKFGTPDNTVTPLTVSSFRKCDFLGTGNEVGWFEAPAVAGLDTTLQNIVFDHCYSRARGFVSGGNVFRFTEVFGGLSFRNCTDESFATGDPTAAGTILKFDGARLFRGLRLEGNSFYHRAYNAGVPTGFIVDAACPVSEYSGLQNWLSQGSRWRFANLSNAYHDTLAAPASFEAVVATLVDVVPINRASLANIILPANRMSRAFDWSYPGNPTGNVNPERRNTSILNTYDSTIWVPVGGATGVDSFSWLEMMVRRAGSGLPTSGTFPIGALRWKSVPVAGGKIGWVNLTDGTAGTLNGGATVGSISSGDTMLTVNTASGLALGNFITIAGVSGKKRVVGISGTTITIDTAADATVTGAAIAFSAPVWREFGAIDP